VGKGAEGAKESRVSKPGRKLEGALAAVDRVLERWGKEVGPDNLIYAKLNWPPETMLARIRREGAGAGQQGKPSTTISDEALAVDKAVSVLPSELTREVLRLWYCSSTRWNQISCAKRLRVGERTFRRHLHDGRLQVAEILDIVT
jgi:predicted DNA-binding protein (UPF0251 family)